MNKFLRLMSIAALSLAACGERTSIPAANPSNVTTATGVILARSYDDIDPVCGMVRDSTWTDFTLYNGDTLWFCATPERRAFVANPQKYLALRGADSNHSHQP